jgi:hypothetical protein
MNENADPAAEPKNIELELFDSKTPGLNTFSSILKIYKTL